jgi:LysR family transcriptional regulator, transcriptional activator of the cysJI operon
VFYPAQLKFRDSMASFQTKANDMGLESAHLKTFRVVAEQLSFTHAAERLFLTQPAVTLQIKALEEELGLRLFDRTGQRIALTPAGQLLRKYAVRLSDVCAEAEQAMSALRGEIGGRVTLGASTTIAQYLLPRLAGEFLAENPDVELSMFTSNTAGVVSALLENRIALGLIEGPSGRTDFKTEPFLEDEIVLVAPPSHEWVDAGTPISPHALTQVPLLVREHGSGTRQVVEEALAKAKVLKKKLHVVMELDSTEAIKSAVAAGLGVGFVSRWALAGAQTFLRVIPIHGLRIYRHFQFVYPQGPEPGGAAGAFLRFARGRCAEARPR